MTTIRHQIQPPASRSDSRPSSPADRAIYFDFEGLKLQDGESVPPALLGVELNRRFESFVLDPGLQLISRGVAACRTKALEEAVEDLVRRCEEEERRLVSFSCHEQTLVARWTPDLLERFNKVWLNAKKPIHAWAKQWSTARTLLEEDGRTLATYCRIARLPPSQAPAGGPAKAIRRLQAAMGGVRRWRQLKPEIRDLAASLCTYNHEDCRRLRKLTVRAHNSGRGVVLPQGSAMTCV